MADEKQEISVDDAKAVLDGDATEAPKVKTMSVDDAKAVLSAAGSK
jgi:hypothetical protein